MAQFNGSAARSPGSSEKHTSVICSSKLSIQFRRLDVWVFLLPDDVISWMASTSTGQGTAAPDEAQLSAPS